MSSDLIVSTPETCGGKPRIAGHRVRVMDVAVLHEQGLSPARILESFPSLTLAKVQAALAYYADHQAEIRQDLARDSDLFERLRSETPSLLQHKLRQPDGL